MSIHVESAPWGFGLRMKLKSLTSKVNMTVRTPIDNPNFLNTVNNQLGNSTLGFKSKRQLNQFQSQGMMYFNYVNGKLEIQFVGDFNTNDINSFIKGLVKEFNRIYHPETNRKIEKVQNIQNKRITNTNNRTILEQQRQNELKEKRKLEQLKKEQEAKLREKEIKLEQKRIKQEAKLIEEKHKLEEEKKEQKLREKRIKLEQEEKANLIKEQIKLEEVKLKQIQEEISKQKMLQEQQKLKEIELEKENIQKALEEEKLYEEHLKLKEKELKLKQKYENYLEDDSNSPDNSEIEIIDNSSKKTLIVPSKLTDITLINQVSEETFLGFSSQNELKNFQNIGEIKIKENENGTYDFLFYGDYEEQEAEKYVDSVTEEYALIIQERTYLKVKEKIKENNLSLESEIIDNEDSILLTLNI